MEEAYKRMAMVLLGIAGGILMGFGWGISVKRDAPPIDRRIGAHDAETHKGIAVVDKTLHLMVCTDCGVVFVPEHYGLAMSPESWDRVQPAQKR